MKENVLCGALAEGVKLERESRAFYSAHAAAAKDGAVRALFELLAREEEGHERVLRAMQEGKTCPVNSARELRAKAPKIGGSHSLSSEEVEAYSETLLASMDFEKKTRAFYEKLVSDAPSAPGAPGEEEKKVFRELAAFEEKHFELLDSLYEQLNDYRLQT